jgi:hypothetical protein
MSGIAIGLGAAGLALQVYGMQQQQQASSNAAAVDTATAAFNAKLDIENAQQIDLNTQENIDTMRTDEKTYLSREAAGYASAGVLATSGSALHAQITNVGRFTKQIQQEYANSQVKQQNLYEAAKVGIAEGNAQAGADQISGTIALLNGSSKLASTAYSDYRSGVFSGVGSAPTTTDEGGLF